MKIQIQFGREASYHEKKLTLLLMRYFNPTKFMLSGLAYSWSSKGPEVTMEGALPINPFEAMDQINEAISKEFNDWSPLFEITYIEMESQMEKKKIDTWILVDKIKPGILI